MSEREFHRLLDFLYLLVESTNVCICFLRCLFQLHDGDHGVRVIPENAHDGMHTMIEQDGASRLQLILVYKGQDGHVVLRAHGGGHDGVVVVNYLLQGAHRHGGATKIVHLGALLLILLLLGLQHLLITNKLLLHEQVVLDTLQFQQLEPTFRVWSHQRQFVGRIRTTGTLTLLPYSGGHGRLILLPLRLLPLLVSSTTSGLLISHHTRTSLLLQYF
uniref:Uncharacterized protein n=1 Tax=Lepeophtheirus salmonis TaxID=72036 RepID=A0A0K2UNX3_LEPSM